MSVWLNDTLVVLASFEGPDPYAMAGGLGRRVSTLARAFSAAGHETHLFFLGDPNGPGEERLDGGRLVFHRWAQWVSQHHPLGVYAGEIDKRREVISSLPPRLGVFADEAVRQGRPYIMLFEDWQMAEAARVTWDVLRARGLLGPGRGAIGHNTNTLMGVGEARLSDLWGRVKLFTVSRFMKHALWPYGVNPIVVPNGLPPSAFEPPDEAVVAALSRLSRAGRTVVAKIARFDPDKAWLDAVSAIAALRWADQRPFWIVRGGLEGYAHEVLRAIRQAGLRVVEAQANAPFPTPDEAKDVDVWLLRSRLTDPQLRGVYAAADAVLAQSGIEPFGLVGLEVMAQGGAAIVGATGEDYARHGRNAFVAELGTAEEVAHLVRRLKADRRTRSLIRRAGTTTARHYAWSEIIPELMDRFWAGGI